MYQLSLHSPVGDLTLFAYNDHIVALEWGWGALQTPSALLETARQQLYDYFDGKRTVFDLPLDPSGTDFQRKVWHKMTQIPYGEMSTYGTIAKALNSHARAVGGACGRNPIPIIIPCHRVLGEQGRLGGYSGEGGATTKRELLILEGQLLI